MKRRHIFRNTILIIFSFIILLIAWGIFSSYHILTVTEYEVCSDKIAEDINVVLISDLHNHEFGRSNAALVKKIRKLQPDLILLAGDFLNSESPDDHVPVELIEQLVTIAPVYFSLGNQEKDYIKKAESSTLITDLVSAGAVVLDKDYIHTEVNGTDTVIGGLYAYAFGTKMNGLFDKSENPEEVLAFLESFQAESCFKIMMAHRPDSFLFRRAKETWDI